jgi:hypothetical protein
MESAGVDAGAKMLVGLTDGALAPKAKLACHNRTTVARTTMALISPRGHVLFDLPVCISRLSQLQMRTESCDRWSSKRRCRSVILAHPTRESANPIRNLPRRQVGSIRCKPSPAVFEFFLLAGPHHGRRFTHSNPTIQITETEPARELHSRWHSDGSDS